MNQSFHMRFTQSIIAALLLLAAGQVAAADAGVVVYARGTSYAEQGGRQEFLRRGSTVEVGDDIVTESSAYVQIRLLDNTMIAVRENSSFVIDELEAPARAGRPAIGSGRTLRASFSLNRGGFRTSTGRIAARQPSAYRITTPSAVIGVRGTNYEARLCQGGVCAADDGLYVGVTDGNAYMQNNGGTLELGQSQFGYARDFNTAPVRLPEPPPTLTEDPVVFEADEEEEEEEEDVEAEESSEEEEAAEDESPEESRDEDESADGRDESDGSEESSAEEADTAEALASERAGDQPDATSATATRDTATARIDVADTDEPERTIQAESATGGSVDLTDGRRVTVERSFVFSDAGAAGGQNIDLDRLTISTSGELSAFSLPGSNDTSLEYALGTGAARNLGMDPVTLLKWGRWASPSGTANVGDLHWILAPEESLPVRLISGSANYVLVGNTDPTDSAGNVGVLGSAALSADFTNQTVQSAVELGINGSVWKASGSGDITVNVFEGVYDAVTINGDATGSGDFNGIFNRFEDGLPNGAGVGYRLLNGDQAVSGAAVFNRAGN